MRTLVRFLPLVLSGAVLLAQSPPSRVSLVVDSELGAGAQHGVTVLERQLGSKGAAVRRSDTLRKARQPWVIVAGPCSSSNAVGELAAIAGLSLPTEPESLVVHSVRWNEKNALLICGADDRGLMYAALDVAEQIRLAASGENPLAGIANAREKPDTRERSVTKMIMNRGVVEKYYYSEEFWERYLDMLARDRYNTFVLMLGYGSAGYYDPPYPFLFDLPEFPGVKVIGITPREQQRNLEMLRAIIRMTHERGLDFKLALWTHIFVAGYNNALEGDRVRPGFVAGLSQENLVSYTKVALREFLRRLPDLDGIQFRVHTESSVTLPQQQQFWTQVLETVASAAPGMPVDMRAKGFTDDLIDGAIESPVKMRMTTKHWGEQTGLPYHPTQDYLKNKYKRRHSYADLLRYPKRYGMLYRLWSHGTNRILLWGDPDFARRFARSTHVWDGEGFDIHEPLAMKMGYKLGLHDQPPYELLSPEYQYYEWEFERYWHYYQVFGRLGYNADTPPRVWKAEFESRFGPSAAPHVEEAYHQASWVLPRIVAYALRDLSAGFAWSEKQRWEDLPEYVDVRPSDTAMFLGIEEAARFHVSGIDSPKIWPLANGAWFAGRSAAILREVAAAESAAGREPGKEFRSTMLDMKILAYLAEYHSRRLEAGWHYALARETKDVYAYDDAIASEKTAIDSWRRIVELADGVYPDNIIFGRSPRMDGSWKTELAALDKGLANLEADRSKLQASFRTTVARLDFGYGSVERGYLPVTPEHLYSLADGGYGWHHIYELPPESTAEPSPSVDSLADFIHGPEPDEYAYSAFGIDLPDGEYEVLCTMMDPSDDHGPMWIAAQGMETTDRFRVPAGQKVEKRIRARVVDGRLNIVISSATDGDWIINRVVVERVEPSIGHVPVRRARGDGDIRIRSTVSGPDPIQTVRLVYGLERERVLTTPMRATGDGRYEATIPGGDVSDGMMYFIDVADEAGRRITLPRGGAEEPYRILISTDEEPPVVAHRPVLRSEPGRSIVIEADVTDPSGVESVHVRYRGVSQHQDFARLRLFPTGEGNRYRAEIPAGDVDPRWDLMYYLEAFDRRRNGVSYPNLETETPYVVVRLHPGSDAPPGKSE